MRLAVYILALCFVFLSLPASADSLTGKVVKITDGDTLYVLNTKLSATQIRLAGIDARHRLAGGDCDYREIEYCRGVSGFGLCHRPTLQGFELPAVGASKIMQNQLSSRQVGDARCDDRAMRSKPPVGGG